MIISIQNLVLIGLFVFKILSKNSILMSIKGSNSAANLPKFKLIQAFMHVRDTCKNEVDQIKNEGARVFTTLYVIFFRRARADNSGVGGGIWPKFEFIEALMHAFVTCKKEDERFKNEGAKVFTRFLP